MGFFSDSKMVFTLFCPGEDSITQPLLKACQGVPSTTFVDGLPTTVGLFLIVTVNIGEYHVSFHMGALEDWVWGYDAHGGDHGHKQDTMEVSCGPRRVSTYGGP